MSASIAGWTPSERRTRCSRFWQPAGYAQRASHSPWERSWTGEFRTSSSRRRYRRNQLRRSFMAKHILQLLTPPTWSRSSLLSIRTKLCVAARAPSTPSIVAIDDSPHDTTLFRPNADVPTTAAESIQCYLDTPIGPSSPIVPRPRVNSKAAAQFQIRHYECEARTAPSSRSSSPTPSASSTEYPEELYDIPFLDASPALQDAIIDTVWQHRHSLPVFNDEDGSPETQSSQLDMYLNSVKSGCRDRRAGREWQVCEDTDYPMLAYYVLSITHAVRERPFPPD